jgi:hypothetical protein
MGSSLLSLQDAARDARDWGATRRRLISGFEVPWIAEPFFEIGAQPVPAYIPPGGAGAQIVLCTHRVPTNYKALVCGIVLGYQGGTPIPLPGDVVYTIDVNRQLGLLTSGYPVKDFGNIPIQVGAFNFAPWPVEFLHSSDEIIRVKAYSVQNVGVGLPNYLTAALIGFEWPARE